MKINYNYALLFVVIFFTTSCKIDQKKTENLLNQNKSAKTKHSIHWSFCDKIVSDENRNKITIIFECGTMDVPLNWNKPNGKKINLSFIRSKAKNNSKRIGTLIVNNGGPGSGSFKLATNMSTLPIYREFAESFDIVGMDPRGVGESTPIKCSKEWNGNYIFPKNESEFNSLLDENTKYYQACMEGSGELLDYIDTENVARDLEAARLALGNEKLNFFGYSYGSAIAAKYAELFPRNSRALIMDGVLDHSQENTIDFARTEINAAEKNLSHFAKWCDNDPSCKLPNQSILSAFDKIIKDANEMPKIINGNKKINGAEIQSITQLYLSIGKTFWKNLADAIKETENGNANKFGFFYSHTLFKHAQNAIQCLDYPSNIKNWKDYLEFKTAIEEASPHLSGYVQSSKIVIRCIGWKSSRSNPPKRLKITKKQPVLLVTTKHDPSTSYEWSERVLKQIPGSININYYGYEHTGYAHSKCTREFVNNFLISGIKPTSNTTCNEE